MLPATGMRETRVERYMAGNRQLCDEPVEHLLSHVGVVIPCEGTNTSGTTKSSAGPRLLSSRLDSAWCSTGTTASSKFYRVAAPTNADGPSLGDKQMALLEAAAIVGNIDQFIDVYQSIDLHDRPESDIVCIVQLALGIGAMTAARETCAYGLTRYPDNSELIKMQTIFAPPRITVNRHPSASGTRANTEWLAAHGDEYRGKWVALRAGVLVASGNSVDEILQTTGDVRGTNIFITPVY